MNIFAADCQDYTVRCECFPATPFEGFQMYVVQTCDTQETWEKYYGKVQFDTEELCLADLAADKNCPK